MRYVLTLLLLFSSCFGRESWNITVLVDRGGIKYSPTSSHPYDGEVFDLYENGEISFEGQYKDGLKSGKWVYYHPTDTYVHVVEYYDHHTYQTLKRVISTEIYSNGVLETKLNWLKSDDSGNLTQGHFEEWYRSGGKKREGETSGIDSRGNPIQNGKWKEWYENGSLRLEGNFRSGKEHGEVSEWYENGRKKSKSNFISGKKHGESLSWYENGQKSNHTSYSHGILTGLGRGWYENGQLFLTGNTIDGKFDGQVRQYYENGKSWKTVHYSMGKKHGNWKEWDEKGKLTVNIEYLFDGVLRDTTGYYDSGEKKFTGQEIDFWKSDSQKIVSEHYGKWKWWYSDGSIKQIGEFKFLEPYGYSFPVGEWKGWYQNGQLEYSTLKNDKEKPELTETWYDNGQKKTHDYGIRFPHRYHHYTRMGITVGKFVSWYENGVKESEGYYDDDGQRTLSETSWYTSGEKQYEVIPRQDTTGVYIEYYENGNIKHRNEFLESRSDIEHGLYEKWYEDGTPKLKGRMDINCRVGKWVFWDQNGDLMEEINY